MGSSPKLSQVGRVAFRVEGANWNAYWALPDSMKGAVFIASTRFAPVEGNVELKAGFMAYVRSVVDAIFLAEWGKKPDWPEPAGRPAPEHERTRE